jgi:hypothetical protein
MKNEELRCRPEGVAGRYFSADVEERRRPKVRGSEGPKVGEGPNPSLTFGPSDDCLSSYAPSPTLKRAKRETVTFSPTFATVCAIRSDTLTFASRIDG